jgi:hypothetical protein
MHQIDELRSLIARVRRRWFGVVAMRTAGRAAIAAAVPILAAVAADRLLAPQGPALIVVALFTVVTVIAAVAMVFRRMQRRPDDRKVARFIEERAGEIGAEPPFDDTLVSAVEMAEAPEPNDRAFGALIVGQAVAQLRTIEVERLIPGASLRRSAVQLVASCAILAAALIPALPGLQRAVETAWLSLFPHSVVIAVTPGDARIVAGQPLKIQASLRTRGTDLQYLVPSLVVSAGGQQRTVPMKAASDGFEFTFESVDRSFVYEVTAATASSGTYSVTALVPPRVKRIDVGYDYPSFTGLKNRVDEDSGDVYGPAGTRVRLRIHTDKPISSGELSFPGGRTLSATAAGQRAVDVHLVLTKDDSYRVRLADADGLHSIGDTEYFIRLMDDRPPEVRILRPSADQGITPLEEVAIEARADDDYGVASFDLVYAVAGRGERVVRFTNTTGTNVSKVGSYLLAAEELRVQPGDVITYYARARDIGRGKRSTETRSDIFFLEVKPFGEEFVSAQSQAMAGGGGTQIDSLIAAQKEIINATWNLERRAVAGRSAADLKAIAEAQAELKTRVEQMASMGRRRRSPRLPQQQIPPSPAAPRQGGADPVSAAIEAMGRAVQQLESERTKEAIPYEMTALQGLLQAQAEIRRRQVLQQSASGASQGGSGRQGQDLSALFDRELQRQQRTNYEASRRSGDETERQDDASALDRIRDLARRQEDLSRRQRELANAGLSAEEVKRQLETLMREQVELRRQLEEISKGSKDSAGSERSRGSQNSQELRDVAEQMRGAANELQRQDANAAADRAQRAAERLRNLEQQMRGNGLDAQQRAAGELRLEAQQIADAQRRIATETSRLEQGRQAGNTDALRRLAAEKEKLADRVDELQRTAERLGGQPEKVGRQGDAARLRQGFGGQADMREAARELQREQIGRRMRESAKEMRAASEGRAAGNNPAARPQAQIEDQLARALDRVLDTLGGRPQADARQLAERLDQTREIRERLNRLEQQMRDAGTRQRAGVSSQRGGQEQARGRGEQNQQGRNGRAGGGAQADELSRLREEYARELQRARQALGRLEAEARSGTNMSTPEEHEYSRSAPGTEAFKQDFSGWESLRKDLDLALERYESAVSDRLARRPDKDRLSAGGSERMPEAYRKLIARYYESLAKVKR